MESPDAEQSGRLVQDLRAGHAARESLLEKVLALKLEPVPTRDLEMLAFPMNMQGHGAAGSLVGMVGRS